MSSALPFFVPKYRPITQQVQALQWSRRQVVHSRILKEKKEKAEEVWKAGKQEKESNVMPKAHS